MRNFNFILDVKNSMSQGTIWKDIYKWKNKKLYRLTKNTDIHKNAMQYRWNENKEEPLFIRSVMEEKSLKLTNLRK